MFDTEFYVVGSNQCKTNQIYEWKSAIKNPLTICRNDNYKSSRCWTTTMIIVESNFDAK